MVRVLACRSAASLQAAERVTARGTDDAPRLARCLAEGGSFAEPEADRGAA
jgi:hypothetical protein